MSKPLKRFLFIVSALVVLALLALLPSLTGSKVTYAPSLVVDGTLYVSTHTPIEASIPAENILGRTTFYTEKQPRKNGESNILSPDGLDYASWEDGLAVEVDGEWIFFKKK